MTDRRGRGGWFSSGGGGGGDDGGRDLALLLDRLDGIANRLTKLEEKLWEVSATTVRLETDLKHKPSKGYIVTVTLLGLGALGTIATIAANLDRLVGG